MLAGVRCGNRCAFATAARGSLPHRAPSLGSGSRSTRREGRSESVRGTHREQKPRTHASSGKQGTLGRFAGDSQALLGRAASVFSALLTCRWVDSVGLSPRNKRDPGWCGRETTRPVQRSSILACTASNRRPGRPACRRKRVAMFNPDPAPGPGGAGTIVGGLTTFWRALLEVDWSPARPGDPADTPGSVAGR